MAARKKTTRQQFIERLAEISSKVGKQSYDAIREKYGSEFDDKLSSHERIYGDFSVEARLEKKDMDKHKKNRLLAIVAKLKSNSKFFDSSDVESLEQFTSSIDSTVNHNQYISNIKDGESNYLLGRIKAKHSMDIVLLFNEIKENDSLNDFFENSKIEPIFLSQGNFKSFLIILFAICKNCQENSHYPLYYKFYQNIAKWCYGCDRGDYDSFVALYSGTDISDPRKALAFDTYYHYLAIDIKGELEKAGMADTLQDRNYLESELFNVPDESFVFVYDDISDIQMRFRDWLKINIPTSADKYYSYFTSANKISIGAKLGNLYKWTKEDWTEKESQLRNLEVFDEKNRTGHYSLTASIAKYKEFFNMVDSVSFQVPPVKPFSDFKWRWAVTTPSESINTPEILLGVLEILVKHDGKKHATQDFKKDLYRLQKKIDSPIDLAKMQRPVNKNIIENSGQYWKALGLLNTTHDGTISVTELGTNVVKGKISKEDYLKYLYNNFTLPNTNIESNQVISLWKEHKIKIYPLQIIFQVLHRITQAIQSPSDWHMSQEELRDIIIPLSIYSGIDLEIYVQHVLEYRINPDAYKNWPNCTPLDNDYRMVKEYLLFLSNFGFLNAVELRNGSKRYYLNEASLQLLEEETSLNVTANRTVKIPPPALFDYKQFHQATKTANLKFSEKLVVRFVASLWTKPFLILTGLSGSGKTKLAQSFVKWICEREDQYRIIPVGADWTNREPLLGYPNGLDSKSYVCPESGALQLVLNATDNQDLSDNLPYFLILDEMNLSHVERYFADFLSVMESKDKIKLYSGQDRLSDGDEKGIPQEITWPKNLFIIGTVNIDETTYMFSPKVLDRANVIEFRVSREDISSYLADPIDIDMDKFIVPNSNPKTGLGSSMASDFLKLAHEIVKSDIKDNETLVKFFEELQKASAEYGFRSAHEIKRLISLLNSLTKDDKKWDKTDINETDDYIDIAIMQKLLPKLHGSRSKLTPILTTLGKLCVSNDYKGKDKDFASTYFKPFDEVGQDKKEMIIYPLSFEKIARMYKSAIDHGYTSYAEA